MFNIVDNIKNDNVALQYAEILPVDQSEAQQPLKVQYATIAPVTDSV